MLKLSSLLLLLLVISITACKKDSGKPQRNLDPELKSFFNFRKGSYWIYKEATSSVLDSMVVDNYFIDPAFSTSDYFEEKVTLGISEYKTSTGIFGGWTFQIEPNSTTCIFAMIPFSAGVIDYFPFSPKWPFQTGSISGTDLTIAYYPSMQISGTTYDSVYEFHFEHQSGQNSIDDYIYMNSSYGFLRFKFNNHLRQDDLVLDHASLKRQ